MAVNTITFCHNWRLIKNSPMGTRKCAISLGFTLLGNGDATPPYCQLSVLLWIALGDQYVLLWWLQLDRSCCGYENDRLQQLRIRKSICSQHDRRSSKCPNDDSTYIL